VRVCSYQSKSASAKQDPILSQPRSFPLRQRSIGVFSQPRVLSCRTTPLRISPSARIRQSSYWKIAYRLRGFCLDHKLLLLEVLERTIESAAGRVVIAPAHVAYLKGELHD
jgi:hypothetical protein